MAKFEIISIHAPRAGSDRTNSALCCSMFEFQSTLPVRGATHRAHREPKAIQAFQSTLPVRGATGWQCRPSAGCLCYFNPRSPCGERPAGETGPTGPKGISIHAPRAGSDADIYAARTGKEFQSTLPVRGATWYNVYKKPNIKISIHAPRAGSDQDYIDALAELGVFQSTLPVRGATGELPDISLTQYISIHAPRAGSDDTKAVQGRRKTTISIHAPRAGSDKGRPRRKRRPRHFNPRSPCGERPGGPCSHGCSSSEISIHAPRAGSDTSPRRAAPNGAFQSTLPVRGATLVVNAVAVGANISIHAPRAGSDQ